MCVSLTAGDGEMCDIYFVLREFTSMSCHCPVLRVSLRYYPGTGISAWNDVAVPWEQSLFGSQLARVGMFETS